MLGLIPKVAARKDSCFERREVGVVDLDADALRGAGYAYVKEAADECRRSSLPGRGDRQTDSRAWRALRESCLQTQEGPLDCVVAGGRRDDRAEDLKELQLVASHAGEGVVDESYDWQMPKVDRVGDPPDPGRRACREKAGDQGAGGDEPADYSRRGKCRRREADCEHVLVGRPVRWHQDNQDEQNHVPAHVIARPCFAIALRVSGFTIAKARRTPERSTPARASGRSNRNHGRPMERNLVPCNIERTSDGGAERHESQEGRIESQSPPCVEESEADGAVAAAFHQQQRCDEKAAQLVDGVASAIWKPSIESV